MKVNRIGPCVGALGRCKGLSEAIAEGVANADVVHLHGIWEEIQHLGARAARAACVPYIVTAHGMLDDWALRQSRLKKRLYMLWRGNRNLRGAAAIHCTSLAEAQQVEALKLGSPTVVEPLGIDFSEFEHLPVKGSFRAQWPQIANRPLVVYLGRIHPGKGVEYLIPALANCRSKAAVLAVIGPDSEGFRAKMEALARVNGVAERVVFTGMLRGVDRLAALADASVFSMPSDHENFGLSAAEALAAGTPVLLSKEVNIYAEIVGAGVGEAVGNNVAAVSDALDRWLSDDNLRNTAAAKAEAFARSTYNWDAIAAQWKQHYRNFVDEGVR